MPVDARMPSDSNQELFMKGKGKDEYLYYTPPTSEVDENTQESEEGNGEKDKKDDSLKVVKEGTGVLVYKPPHWNSSGKWYAFIQEDCLIQGDGKEYVNYGSRNAKYMTYTIAGLEDGELVAVYKNGNTVYLKNGDDIFIPPRDVKKKIKK